MFKMILALGFVLTSAQVSMASEKLTGKVKIDGSSTVFPITEAVAEEFNKKHARVRVTIGVSGTGGGFKKFANGEIDINNASRVIKAKEKSLAKKNGVGFLELPIAYDGITIAVNPNNDWASTLTVAQLKKLWQPGSKVTTWKDLNPKWPNRKIKLYGPGPDSGTFDYFSKKINGKSGASRADYTKSEDDNILVQGISGDKDALGFFGFAYYEANKGKVKAVAIKYGKSAPVVPSLATIRAGTYKPLSRPVFIYIGQGAAKKPQTKEFVRFYLTEAESLVKEIGYVPMAAKEYASSVKSFEKFTTKK